jgi:transcriptional regulator with XRE-family HTH domain
MEISKAFGLVLRELRKSRGLTQEKLGFEAELRRTFVSLLELGEQQPTLMTIFKLASALEVSPSNLIRMVEEKLEVSDQN